MRMARVNVYLPDALARAARASGLNISCGTQTALAASLAHEQTDRWLEDLGRLPRTQVPHTSVLRALDEGRAEFADRGHA